ncbi:hypothetical protein OA84_04720 [Kaistella solincola]|uniref:Glycosyl transferase family 1 domain-containing protein n=1 Tax=Kaistella solincola TaxID=510955 RepID=A0ABR4ZRT8_9FLAO|nr:hypothetical protein OA84_04720 [Kaistella solincola]
MKLLYITNGINGAGGLERVLSIKGSYLAENYNYEVTILSLNDNHQNPFYIFSNRIKMHSISVKGNPIQYLSAYKKGVQNIVTELHPDIISVCDDGLKGFFVPSLIKTPAKIIYERHASIRLNTGKGIIGKISAWIMKKQSSKFDRFVVLTPTNINEWSGSNIIAIPNPLSFNPTASSSLDQRKIIVVGSHSYHKGFDSLVEIWKNIELKFPKWELHVYGKIDEDQTYVKQAEALHLQHVHFHNPVKDIQKEYLNSSIMLLPSRSEGFGMVLIEAMACGVPCISFDCPSGPRDIITDGEDGFIIEDQHKFAFEQAVEKLIKDDQLRKKLGAQAKINAQEYTVNLIVERWNNLFQSLLNKQSNQLQ